MCALSPTANVIHTVVSDGNLAHNLDTVCNPLTPAPAHRGRSSGKYAISPGPGTNSSPVAAVSGSGCVSSVTTGFGSSGTTGGGFASLVPHTGKLLAALLSALPGACRHPESAGKTVQGEMARTLASLLRFAKVI